MRGFSLVAASGGHSSSRCAGLSLSRPLLLRGTSSRRAGSVVVAHGPSCSAARGIFPDQGSNPCPLHRQANSQPLCHQGSPRFLIFNWLQAARSGLEEKAHHVLTLLWAFISMISLIFVTFLSSLPLPHLLLSLLPPRPFLLLFYIIRICWF